MRINSSDLDALLATVNKALKSKYLLGKEGTKYFLYEFYDCA